MNSTDSHQLSKGNTMSKYVPKIGTIIIPETVKEKTLEGVLNLPEPGTPIRATLGETVIVGTVSADFFPYALIRVDIKPRSKKVYAGLLQGHALWVEDGWEFELLGEVVTS